MTESQAVGLMRTMLKNDTFRVHEFIEAAGDYEVSADDAERALTELKDEAYVEIIDGRITITEKGLAAISPAPKKGKAKK